LRKERVAFEGATVLKVTMRECFALMATRSMKVKGTTSRIGVLQERLAGGKGNEI